MEKSTGATVCVLWLNLELDFGEHPSLEYYEFEDVREAEEWCERYNRTRVDVGWAEVVKTESSSAAWEWLREREGDLEIRTDGHETVGRRKEQG